MYIIPALPDKWSRIPPSAHLQCVLPNPVHLKCHERRFRTPRTTNYNGQTAKHLRFFGAQRAVRPIWCRLTVLTPTKKRRRHPEKDAFSSIISRPIAGKARLEMGPISSGRFQWPIVEKIKVLPLRAGLLLVFWMDRFHAIRWYQGPQHSLARVRAGWFCPEPLVDLFQMRYNEKPIWKCDACYSISVGSSSRPVINISKVYRRQLSKQGDSTRLRKTGLLRALKWP